MVDHNLNASTLFMQLASSTSFYFSLPMLPLDIAYQICDLVSQDEDDVATTLPRPSHTTGVPGFSCGVNEEWAAWDLEQYQSKAAPIRLASLSALAATSRIWNRAATALLYSEASVGCNTRPITQLRSKSWVMSLSQSQRLLETLSSPNCTLARHFRTVIWHVEVSASLLRLLISCSACV